MGLTRWINLDDGKRQNVPDLLIQLGGLEILLECKTCLKSPPLIKKEEAWAVIQKSSDFDKTMRRVTLGKPAFDETSKKKAVASNDITLIEHSTFMEGLLRVHSGTLPPGEFLSWLAKRPLRVLEYTPTRFLHVGRCRERPFYGFGKLGTRVVAGS